MINNVVLITLILLLIFSTGSNAASLSGINPLQIDSNKSTLTEQLHKQRNGTTDSGDSCWVKVSSPPPDSLIYGSAEWIAWWDGCVPITAVGPGVRAGCDLDNAWQISLYHCCIKDVKNIIADGRSPSLTTCQENEVMYSWVSYSCRVTDAVCGFASDSTPTGFVPIEKILQTQEWLDYSDGDTPASTLGDVLNKIPYKMFDVILFPTDTSTLESAAGLDEKAISAWSEEEWEEFINELSDEQKEEFDFLLENARKDCDDNCVKNIKDGQCKGPVAEGWEMFCMVTFKIEDERTDKKLEENEVNNTTEEESNFMDPPGDDDPCESPLIHC